ncbi:hypothetical protein HN011_003599 [Eciton burchellii]|nr:hypothetical protein HN011_003599 [Eciton burchellii]
MTVRPLLGWGAVSIKILLKRGINQGNPLSPVLFNVILDPIIEAINSGTTGINMARKNVSILAFADDIVLISKNTTMALEQLTMFSSYLTQLGMKLTTWKCSIFQNKISNQTWYLADSRPWTDVDRTVDIASNTGAANNIAEMKLKPRQKDQLIRMHLLSRYILVAAPSSIGSLAKIDGEIRLVYRRIFKLHPSTTDVSTDLYLLNLSEQLDKQCSEYAKSLGIPWPATIDNVNEARRNLRRRDRALGPAVYTGTRSARIQGDKIDNVLLRNPKLLKHSRHIDALKICTNTYGTRVVLNSISPINRMCRGCGMQRETLGHILGMCHHTKNKHIRMHDEIKHFIAEGLPPGFSTFIEPAVKDGCDLPKPDVIIKDKDRLMADAHTEKAKKYIQIKTEVGLIEGGGSPIYMGCRGVKPRSTVENLRKHDIRDKGLITISMSAHCFSIEIANAVIYYVRIV